MADKLQSSLAIISRNQQKMMTNTDAEGAMVGARVTVFGAAILAHLIWGWGFIACIAFGLAWATAYLARRGFL